ncbi:hypothetical protein K466DRAFT_16588 [Polyporus arcularius HHB13444]|uniref:Uncharacterized protein n=1 Tax=Polyporus arcularius HHB13444 TaxID=1314778 RepID=A0A5C3PIN7_9APHY|nr:hypothetical protein K466DRAFT_16588 [Polyporus arcularius HHB13444]
MSTRRVARLRATDLLRQRAHFRSVTTIRCRRRPMYNTCNPYGGDTLFASTGARCAQAEWVHHRSPQVASAAPTFGRDDFRGEHAGPLVHGMSTSRSRRGHVVRRAIGRGTRPMSALVPMICDLIATRYAGFSTPPLSTEDSASSMSASSASSVSAV